VIYLVLLKFASLWLLAKGVSKDYLKFYVAGVIYALVTPIYTLGFRAFGQWAVTGKTMLSWLDVAQILPHTLLVAVLAVIFFGILKRLDEEFVPWIVAFVVGFFVLAFLL